MWWWWWARCSLGEEVVLEEDDGDVVADGLHGLADIGMERSGLGAELSAARLLEDSKPFVVCLFGKDGDLGLVAAGLGVDEAVDGL